VRDSLERAAVPSTALLNEANAFKAIVDLGKANREQGELGIVPSKRSKWGKA